jgi:MerR family transcriptional regulator, heat shock protein HspR
MTNELGLNLAGVERVLALEEQLARATRRLEALERRSREMREEMEAEVEKVRRSFRAEIVPYQASTEIVRMSDATPGRHRIRVERETDGRAPGA